MGRNRDGNMREENNIEAEGNGKKKNGTCETGTKRGLIIDLLRKKQNSKRKEDMRRESAPPLSMSSLLASPSFMYGPFLSISFLRHISSFFLSPFSPLSSLSEPLIYFLQ
jgi:hypothetical protein